MTQSKTFEKEIDYKVAILIAREAPSIAMADLTNYFSFVLDFAKKTNGVLQPEIAHPFTISRASLHQRNITARIFHVRFRKHHAGETKAWKCNQSIENHAYFSFQFLVRIWM